MDILRLSQILDGFFWGKFIVYLCLSAGIYFSVRMRFPQLRLIKEMVGQLVGGNLDAEVFLDRSFECGDLFLVPLPSVVGDLVRNGEHVHEGPGNLGLPVVVTAAYMVAAVDPDRTIEEVVRAGKAQFETGAGETAVDPGEVGIRV